MVGMFRYRVLTARGKPEVGFLQARDLFDAREILARQESPLLALEPFQPKAFPRLSAKERLLFTRELERLLIAGLSLCEALSILAEKSRSEKRYFLLLDLCYRVQGGEPFSQALAVHKDNFSLLYVAMIANAETGFCLERALKHLIRLQEKQLYIRKQMTTALLYPVLLGGFCCVVLSLLLFFVIPSLQELFEGRALHPFTLFVFAWSAYAIKGKWLLLMLMSGVIATAIATSMKASWRERALACFVRLPFAKALCVKASWARCFRTAATLLEGGVPLLEALRQGRHVMRHPYMEEVLVCVEAEIAAGQSMAKALLRFPEVPSLIPRMLGVAEESGSLAVMMHQIAEIQEEELEATLQSLATLAQPILLLVLGVVVGFVLLSVLLPLTDVDSFLSM